MQLSYYVIAEILLNIYDNNGQAITRFSWSGLKLVTGISKLTVHDLIAINIFLGRESFTLEQHSCYIDLLNQLDSKYGTSAKADVKPVPMKVLKQHRPAGRSYKGVRELENMHRQYLRREGLYAP